MAITYEPVIADYTQNWNDYLRDSKKIRSASSLAIALGLPSNYFDLIDERTQQISEIVAKRLAVYLELSFADVIWLSGGSYKKDWLQLLPSARYN